MGFGWSLDCCWLRVVGVEGVLLRELNLGQFLKSVLGWAVPAREREAWIWTRNDPTEVCADYLKATWIDLGVLLLQKYFPSTDTEHCWTGPPFLSPPT